MSWMSRTLALCLALLTLTYALPLAKEGSKRSDDTSLVALQTLVQQQAAAIQTLQAKVTELETVKTDVEHLKNGAMQVGFTARSSQDPINTSVRGIVKFDQAVTNVGGGFDPQTGIFTAPVSGLYAFFLTGMARCDQSAAAFSFDQHGSELELIWIDGSINCQDQAASQVTAQMSAGEQMYIKHHSGSTSIRGNWHSVFTGYLLQAQ